MRLQPILLAFALTSTSALLTACGEDDPCAGHTHDPVCLQCSQSEHDSVEPGSINVGTAGSLKIEMVSAAPSPHVEGNNSLTINVMDAGDQPMTGVSFDLVETFYPPGGHGTPIVPQVTELGGGEYEVTLINYVHEGVWTLTFELTAGSITDTIEYEICVIDPDL